MWFCGLTDALTRRRTQLPTEDGLKTLELKHDRAMQILGIRPSFYWRLVREGRIRTLGSGKNSRAVYASIEAYHRSRMTAPKETLKIVEASRRRQAARKANQEIAVE
jgi:hypothetical protein